MDAKKRLSAIAKDLEEGNPVSPITVREFLSWFHSLRRGRWIVEWARNELAAAGLETVPDFESVYIDASFTFVLAQDHKLVVDAVAPDGFDADRSPEASIFEDPTYRLSKLAAANKSPISVAPTTPIREAVTLMIANDFSQLPVVTSDREVKGILSWESLGTRIGLGKLVTEVREAMDPHVEVPAHDSIFQAIPLIVRHGYVLVRGADKKVVGIVTASDLSLQFQQLTEPFLLIGEIENHIRRLLDKKISPDEMARCRLETDGDRAIERVSDLTFGEYLRVIEDPDRWKKIGLPIDRATFCLQLERVRDIRNDVMHFDPDGIPPQDVEHLRKVAQFLKRMQDIGVS